MFIYKSMKTIGIPLYSERANYSNILIGDIVSYKDKHGDINYCKVDNIKINFIYVTELNYSNYILEKNTFMINPNYNKNSYSHKGTLDFKRNIRIVDREQLN
jgi:hypothetical protein